ncbi:MAG: hypothetical protein Q7U98_02610 [Methylicorpusculum sp.]|uniref:hypothetical protein n=1 Tax=Methylicorpusculum sp. TaxID=2713644 RepID=UPI002726E85A|nr:hypothetical protein [Methylicorpusculum sp.]MDO8844834.1 hypothetical protein [Methylicorpusculum sp.]MDO8938031.1 hypothetical protein [Methylicorpusculum sp.]MDO9239322.1 hypothetical protein [Methylicorpusculum sp.]MDP2177659.1 hypothetical protein [Methylicorpusculum sp.]MDP2200718.1 hypothetical protein [Methylicorpusculum sp.]
MKEVDEALKVRRIAAVIYLLIMAFLMTGTYFSQQEKSKIEQEQQVDEKVEIVSEPPLF